MESMMFDEEEIAILNAIENDILVRSVNVDEEIVLARKAATEISLHNDISYNDRFVEKL